MSRDYTSKDICSALASNQNALQFYRARGEARWFTVAFMGNVGNMEQEDPPIKAKRDDHRSLVKCEMGTERILYGLIISVRIQHRRRIHVVCNVRHPAP